MQRPIGAFGERLAYGLRSARGPGAQRHHFAAALLLKLQGFFERVGVGLVDLEAEIGFLNPAAAGVHSQLRVADRYLLYADDYLHV